MEENVQAADSIGAGITAQPSGSQSGVQKTWVNRIKKEQKCHKDFRKRSRDVQKIFNRDHTEPLYVPLYWQVVQVEHSGVYSNQPVPDVRPRNNPNNPVMKDIARIVQRGLGFCVDQPSFDENMHRAVDDYLAMALGVMRVKVDSIINTNFYTTPVYETQMLMDMQTGMPQIDQMGQPMTQEVQTGEEVQEEETIGDQYVRWEFTPWDSFGWEPGNNWKSVDWIYFRHCMTQAQCKERFGRTIAADKKGREHDKDESFRKKTVNIYEIWCKKKREVIFLAMGESEPIEVIPDPLELVNFFPCPQPMMMNLPSDELIPQADYDYIESYDVEINRLQERRMGLMEQIRASGAYDQGLPELSEMFENEDGEYTPVQNLMQRLQAAGGPDNALYHLPIMEKAQVLQQLTEQLQLVRSQVDEVLGISDIVRGVTAASETATAQEIKGRWVGVRLTRKRETVQYTVREMLRITAQLLVSHITPANLQRMTQMQITDEMVKIMNDDILMQFAVDIELDSTIAKDEFKEMQTKQEMLNGVAQYSQSVLPMVQQNQMPAGVASAILKSALAPYARYDRNLDQEMNNLTQTMQQLQQLNQQLQQAQQESQQAQQQAQQWQLVAQQLQEQATAASAQQKQADARKKLAEASKIEQDVPFVKRENIADLELTGAQTIESLARARAAGKQVNQNG